MKQQQKFVPKLGDAMKFAAMPPLGVAKLLPIVTALNGPRAVFRMGEAVKRLDLGNCLTELEARARTRMSIWTTVLDDPAGRGQP